MPTQVALVDLLQLFHEFIQERPFRIGIIISAWDVIEEPIAPSDWIRKYLPLLDQFLKSNSSRAMYRIYGVSAQGGKIPKDRDRLESHFKTSNRIQVVRDDENSSHDITEPVRWVVDVGSD